jgi:hypothetical protein
MLKRLSGAQEAKNIKLTSTSMKLVRRRLLICRARLRMRNSINIKLTSTSVRRSHAHLQTTPVH